MARPLMTPDELRRMDNDDCIIYEKGIKPVKAKKYYYFESPMARKLAEYTLNHLDFNIGERGKWRKYNPYNPYVEDNDKIKKTDLKVESLDDLFEEEPKEKKEEKPQSEIPIENKAEDIVIGKIKQEVEQKQENTIATADAPILPQEQEEDEVFSIDVQKELEAKFDELFGPIDDE